MSTSSIASLLQTDSSCNFLKSEPFYLVSQILPQICLSEHETCAYADAVQICGDIWIAKYQARKEQIGWKDFISRVADLVWEPRDPNQDPDYPEGPEFGSYLKGSEQHVFFCLYIIIIKLFIKY